MRISRWGRVLLAWVAPWGREEEVVGDMTEVHEKNLRRWGRLVGGLITGVETIDMAWALLRERFRRGPNGPRQKPVARNRERRMKPPREPLFSVLDFKLGVRMLVRYPGLTVLGGLAMGFALIVSATAFELISQVVHPKLPLPEGDRIVGITQLDLTTGGGEPRLAFDFTQWQTRVRSIEQLGAYRNTRKNLVFENGSIAVAAIALITPSAFDMAGVLPLMGRPLQPTDSHAAPVVVLGYDIWRDRTSRDPDIVGKTVRVGPTQATVVGVMPEEYGFPFGHTVWMPLPDDLGAYGPAEGPGLLVFGKLAAAATIEEAQAEIKAIREALALESPATHRDLRVEVLPYAESVLGLGRVVSSMTVALALYGSNLAGLLFIVLICGNVALLMFARAVARERELVVRSALGASRRRIVTQLLAEAAVLAGVAGLFALGVLRFAIKGLYTIVEGEIGSDVMGLPFWLHPSLSPSTVLYTGLLVLTAAAASGVFPALKVTRGIRAGLQRATAGGGGFRFGGLWAGIIVTQIAVTVVFPLLTFSLIDEARRVANPPLGISDTEYVSAQLDIPTTSVDDRSTREMESGVTAVTHGIKPRPPRQLIATELKDRLLDQPGVQGVTFTQYVPRVYHRFGQIEVDGPSAEPKFGARGHRLGATAVAIDYFETLGVEIIEGRDFDSADLKSEIGSLIVNESFVEVILGRRNAIGQRVRYVAGEAFGAEDEEPGPWMEIVGVVEDLGTISGYGSQGMYHPMVPGDVSPLNLIVHAAGGTGAIAATLRRLAYEVDPDLQLRNITTLDVANAAQQRFYRFWILLLVFATSLAILLSTGGIYAIMSFTVSQRTQEIGIRTALGSSRARVVGVILRRPLKQVAMGVTGGGLLAFGLVGALGGEGHTTTTELIGVGFYIIVMALVCLTACVVPARRALAVEPSDALRAEG